MKKLQSNYVMQVSIEEILYNVAIKELVDKEFTYFVLYTQHKLQV